ncbi:MAG: rhamnogalacturonan acetylesterase [Solobacterium sp.]|nr:rhamnogalacturonan acetylesterase [Solobacterium sp.]
MQRIIYLGDSTVTWNHIATYPQTGLSQGLLWYVKDDVFIRSFAINGRSTKSFIDQGRLADAKAYIKKGDIVLIQFGHNDQKLYDTERYTDAFGTFQENLREMVGIAKKKGAYPVILSSIARRLFDEKGVFLPGSHGEYPKAAEELAEREGVPFIEMTAKTEEYLMKLGDFASRPMYVYPKDNSHLTVHGAVIYAGFIADGLLALGKPYSDLLVPRNAKIIDEDFSEAKDAYMVERMGEPFNDPSANLDAFQNEKQD